MRALIVVALAAACGGARSGAPPAENPASAPVATAASQTSAPARTGTIAREALDRALAAGPGAMLADVSIEPHFANGDFAGWRIEWIDPEAGLSRFDVRPGDIILAVNGHSIERPTDLHEAWTALSTDDELVVDVEREGVRFQLRFQIVDATRDIVAP